MIVLGIAALILAGVLIAVPALQRNQRNGARRTDINFVQSQIVTYQGNNQGDMPDSLNDFTGSITNNNDDSSFYATGTNSWDAADDWNVIDAAEDEYTNGAAAAAPLTAANSVSDADEFDLWIDGGTAGTAGSSDPGHAPADPLPDNEHFDVFVGFRCTIPTLNDPIAGAGVDSYPNTGTPYVPATNTADPSPTFVAANNAAATAVPNLFVNEDGLARNFAIVYRLEGADIWYCQDNV